jgi:hypothetical protein
LLRAENTHGTNSTVWIKAVFALGASLVVSYNMANATAKERAPPAGLASQKKRPLPRAARALIIAGIRKHHSGLGWILRRQGTLSILKQKRERENEFFTIKFQHQNSATLREPIGFNSRAFIVDFFRWA